MSSEIKKLNRMNPSAKDADLGDKLDAVITLINEIRTLHDTHTHGGVTAGGASTGVPDAGLTTKPAVDPLTS